MKEDYNALIGPMEFESDDEEAMSDEKEEEKDEKTPGFDNDSESEHNQEQDDLDLEILKYEKELREDYDVTRYDIPIGSPGYNEYISLKGTLVVEKIKDIAAEVMSTCEEKLKFEIL